MIRKGNEKRTDKNDARLLAFFDENVANGPAKMRAALNEQPLDAR